ncbi:MAG: ATP-grasp domain-containing protein [Solirubrobacteraceae bacterium]
MSDRTLMIVGGGRQKYREYGLRSIADRYDVVLLASREVMWERAYVSRWRVTDFEDEERFQSDGLSFVKETGAVGLMTWSDRVGERCARLAKAHGMPFADPAAMRACKDKSVFRDLLGARPDWAVAATLVHDLAEARQAADAIGYPVVIKPRALGGSVGVARVDSEQDLERRLASAVDASVGGLSPIYSGAIVEEYLDGKEYSVDCLSLEGDTIPLVVAEKMLGAEPYFEETGHVVPARPTPELADALAVVRDVHRAVGVDYLATHTEFRLTATGPRLIEMNARLGGDFIPRLGNLALGIDLPVAAAEVAMGERPRLPAARRCVAAVRFFYPKFDMELSQLELGGSGHRGLVAFETLVGAGATMRLPPRGYMSRLGYAIVTGASRAECMDNLDAVESDIVARGEAL